MNAGAAAGGAVVSAIVAVLMGNALGMEGVVIVGMHMIMVVLVAVFVGMGHTVVGVLMGMAVAMIVGVVIAQMVMIQMHDKAPLHFFFIITAVYRKVNGC